MTWMDTALLVSQKTCAMKIKLDVVHHLFLTAGPIWISPNVLPVVKEHHYCSVIVVVCITDVSSECFMLISFWFALYLMSANVILFCYYFFLSLSFLFTTLSHALRKKTPIPNITKMSFPHRLSLECVCTVWLRRNVYVCEIISGGKEYG